MGFKDIIQLEDLIFQTMESLYQAKQNGNKITYELALATLDLLNHDYSKISGKYFIEPARMIKFHEDKWEITWKR